MRCSGSSPVVGSSRSRTRGPLTSACVRPTRRFMPLDRGAHLLSALDAMSTLAMARSTQSGMSRPGNADLAQGWPDDGHQDSHERRLVGAVRSEETMDSISHLEI
jgi:hypothetical protein